jgi:hypothetical protein
VIHEFRVKFKDSSAKRPIIANGLDEIFVYREKERVESPVRITLRTSEQIQE